MGISYLGGIARNALESMGINRELINKSVKTLSKAIYNSNWIGKTISSQIGEGIAGLTSSFGYGSVMDYLVWEF